MRFNVELAYELMEQEVIRLRLKCAGLERRLQVNERQGGVASLLQDVKTIESELAEKTFQPPKNLVSDETVS